MHKHTLKEVMTTHYKNAEDIPWNKVDIKICYAYFKLRKRIEPTGYAILWDWLNNHPESLTISDYVFTEILMSRFDKNSYWKTLNIYGKNQKVTKDTVRYTAQDYISFCHTLHKKIHLTFTSAKKMKEFHDDYAVIIENKYTPIITIPKNTKFKELEKLLPADEFIWIKTKRKIIKEGVEMHHCVATYANLVNKDDCRIDPVSVSAVHRKLSPFCKISFIIIMKNNIYFIRIETCNQSQGQSIVISTLFTIQIFII